MLNDSIVCELRIEVDADWDNPGFYALINAHAAARSAQALEQRERIILRELAYAFNTQRPLPSCIQMPNQENDPPGMSRLLLLEPDEMDGVYL